MIGQRFRALGWVAGIASAATCLYLTSLQVAAERAKLEGVEARIVDARRDMRQLQTELGTRASLRQLERWNDDVLAMAAPRADQYLHGEAELASVGLRELRPPAAGTPGAPVMLASAQATPVPGAAALVTSVVTAVVAPATGPAPVTASVPRVQRVTFVPPTVAAKPLKHATPKPKHKDKPGQPDRSVREAAVTKARPKPAADKATSVRRASLERSSDRPAPAPAHPPARAGAQHGAHTPHTVLTRGALGDITRTAAAEGRRRGPSR